MARREHTDRYAGQVLGWTWSLLHPMILAGVYVFIFSFVFRQRIDSSREFPLDYTAYILTGLASWLNITDTMARTSTALSGKSDLLRQMVFPAKLLPIKAAVASLVTLAVMLGTLQLYVVARFGFQPLVLVLGPIAIVLQFVFLLGLGLILSSLSVFLRDVKDIVQVISLAGVYLIPAFYLPSWVPPPFSPILKLNPFSHFIWCFQDAFFYVRIEHPASWIIATLISFLTYALGHRLFDRLQPAFGSIL